MRAVRAFGDWVRRCAGLNRFKCPPIYVGYPMNIGHILLHPVLPDPNRGH
jgi:hypothetical protein